MQQPKKNKKKPIPATRKDSLDLYNHSRKVEEFYLDDDYKVDRDVDSFAKNKQLQDNDIAYKTYTGYGKKLSYGMFEDDKVSKKEYRKNIDENKYYQRESADQWLNTDAPMQMYDKRIQPKEAKSYISGNDVVKIPSYNNIANKPFDLLTPKEKEQRVAKYGRDGVPDSYQPGIIKKPNTTTGNKVKEKGNKGMVLNETLMSKEKPRQKVQGLNTNITPAGLAVTDTTPTSTEKIKVKNEFNPNQTYNVQEENVRMNDTPGYGSDRDKPNATAIQAVRAKENTDKYNAEIERKYNNSKAKKNPKAQERYKTLKNNVTITPNAPTMEQGGKITNTMKNPNKKPVKKALLGTAIMGGLGIVNSMVASNAAADAAREAKKAAYNRTLQQANVEQANYLTQYNEGLQDDLPVYADGGKVPNSTASSTTGKFDTVGGDLNPISSTAEVVQGNTHNEKKIDNSYGVTLLDDGNPVVNVEDEEVIVDNDLVFSDKLKKGDKTFADIAYAINSKIGDLEVQAKTLTKPAEKFSNERTIQGLKKENEELFKEQELVKANTATNDENVVEVVDNKVPVARWGKKIYDNEDDVFSANAERVTTTAEDLAPMLIDNVANLVTTNSVPSIQKPAQRVAPMINTRINANPALADVTSTINTNNALISGNTSNSAVARSSMTANNLSGLKAKGSILAQKEAQERTLQSEQNKLYADNYNVNAELMDDYSADVRDATLQKNSANSKNLVDGIKDYQAVKQKEADQQEADDVIMLDLMDDQTGDKKRVYDRLGRPLYSKAKNVLAREKRRLNRN